MDSGYYNSEEATEKFFETSNLKSPFFHTWKEYFLPGRKIWVEDQLTKQYVLGRTKIGWKKVGTIS